MRKSTPKLVSYVISEVNTLQSIQQQAIILTKLDHALKTLLPQPLQEACRTANYRHHRLIIEVTNASWLRRLRYEQETILVTLRQRVLPALSGIDFIINPNLAKPIQSKMPEIKVTGNSRKLTIQSAQLIENLAKNCKEGLKDTLIKLALHAKKTNNN